jgi:hypothetical protein
MPRIALLKGDGCHGVGELQGLEAAWDTVLLRGAMRWVAEYERWVLAQYGVAYREACLLAWKKRPVLPRLLPTAWEELAEALEAQPVQRARVDGGGYLVQAEQVP